MDKGKALDAALSQIERSFGKGSIMRMGARQALDGEIEVISSGSLGLDIALGIGGFPQGPHHRDLRPGSSGKTTLTLHAIAEVQKAGGTCAFIDAEHALDPGYAKKLGVETDELLVSQPDNGEQALEIADMLVRSGAVDIMVVDSRRRARAARRNRRRDGRQPRRPAGPADEPGAAQAHRQRSPVEHACWSSSTRSA